MLADRESKPLARVQYRKCSGTARNTELIRDGARKGDRGYVLNNDGGSYSSPYHDQDLGNQQMKNRTVVTLIPLCG